jgi:putative phage-type endonuclease
MSALRPYRVLDLVQGSPEWKAARMEHLTASQAPVPFELSEHQTVLQLWEEKFTKKETEVPEHKKKLFEKAHAAEAAGREWAQNKFKLSLPNLVVVSLEHPDLMASLDGFDEEKRVVFEAKLVGKEKLKQIDSGEIPQDHLCQVQAQLLATGAESCLYFATDLDGEAVHHTIRPDKAYGASIGLVAKQFMDKVRKGEAPEPSARDVVTVEDLRFLRLKELKRALDEADAEYEKLKAELIGEFTKEHPRIRCGDVSITRFFQKGNVDYGKIPALKGVDLEQYRKKPIQKTIVNFKKGEA